MSPSCSLLLPALLALGLMALGAADPGGDVACIKRAKVLKALAPSACAAGLDASEGRCYNNCTSGYSGKGSLCWPICPTGYADLGLFCLKPSRSSPCPGGFRNVGRTCVKSAVYRGTGTAATCAPGQKKVGALCYPACANGTSALGPICVSDCSASSDYSTDCYPFCAASSEDCNNLLTNLNVGTGNAVAVWGQAGLALAGCATTAQANGLTAATCYLQALQPLNSTQVATQQLLVTFDSFC